MKVLYYCPEYYTLKHGGRTHAREFVNAIRQVSGVSTVNVWPDRAHELDKGANQKNLKSYLPKVLTDFIGCFKPRLRLTQELCDEVGRGGYNCLIIRSASHRNILLKNIKKRCPTVGVCVEVNAVRFQEEYQNIWFRRIWQKLEVMRFKYADRIFVVSTYLKNYLRTRGIVCSKIIVNPNGVNQEIFNADKQIAQQIKTKEKVGIPDSAFVLGYVGGMEEFRRLPELIEHVASMRRSGLKNIFLLIVGDGKDMPNVNKKIKENEKILNGWVKILGWVDYHEVPEIMATFDTAIFPFTQPYCSPLKLFEYMALGIPTIGPDVPAVNELFTDGEHIRVVNQNGSDLIGVVSELIQHDEQRRQIARSGKKYVLDHFTWRHNAQRVVREIEKLIEE